MRSVIFLHPEVVLIQYFPAVLSHVPKAMKNFDLSLIKNPSIYIAICKPLLKLKKFFLLGVLWIHFAVVSFPIPVSNCHFLEEVLLLMPHVPRRIQK